MVRRFFRDSAIYAIPAAVGAGTSFITFPLFAHHFPPGSYGVLDLLSFGATLVILIVALEIYQGVGRYVAGESDLRVVRRYASTALWWTVACYAVFAAVVMLFARPISSVVLGSAGSAHLLRIATAWVAAGGILALAQAQLRWQGRARSFAAVSVVQAAASTSGALLLVFGLHMGVPGVLWGQLAGNVLALVLAGVFARDLFGRLFSRDLLTQMLRFSAPLVISNVGVFLNLYADRVVIQHMRSLGELGLYGVGSRVAMLVTLALTGFQGAAAPLFLARREDPATPASIARIFRLFAAMAIALLLGLSILASPLIRLAAASEYQAAVSVVPFLVIATLFANMYFFAPGLVIAEKTAVMAKLTAAAGAGNLILAIALVPPLGLVGAGIATAVTSVAWFAALMRASQNAFHVPHRWHSLIAAAALAVVLVSASFAFLSQSRASALSPGPLTARIVLTFVGAGICGFVCLGSGESRALLRSVRRRVPAIWRGKASRPEAHHQAA